MLVNLIIILCELQTNSSPLLTFTDFHRRGIGEFWWVVIFINYDNPDCAATGHRAFNPIILCLDDELVCWDHLVIHDHIGADKASLGWVDHKHAISVSTLVVVDTDDVVHNVRVPTIAVCIGGCHLS